MQVGGVHNLFGCTPPKSNDQEVRTASRPLVVGDIVGCILRVNAVRDSPSQRHLQPGISGGVWREPSADVMGWSHAGWSG